MPESSKPIVRFRKVRAGWQFVTSTWQVLRREKALAIFAACSLVAAAAILVPFYVFYGTNPAFYHHAAGQAFYTGRGLAAWIVALLLVSVVSSYFTGAILHACMDFFDQRPVSLRRSFAVAGRKFPQLALFGLYSGTVGVVLSLAEQRLPFVGKLVAWLANLGWVVANFFSLPVIMFSDKPVMPLEATKRSAALVRRVWGEGVVASSSMGIIFMLAMFGLEAIWLGLFIFGLSASLGAGFIIGVSVAAGAAFLALILLLNTLNSILVAALYYYATTGQAPWPFKAERLHQVIRPRKQRKLSFGRG